MNELESNNQDAGGESHGQATGSGSNPGLRREERECDLFHYPDSREAFKGEITGIGDFISERINRAGGAANPAIGGASQGAYPAGGINSHLIQQCRKQLRKNKRQIARLDEDIARLQQDREYLLEDNLELEEQIQKLEANQVAIES